MRNKQTQRDYDCYARDQLSRTFYNSSQWKAVRSHKLAVNPLCELCSLQGKEQVADMVHHTIAITTALGWEKRLDSTYLQSLCFECHNVVESEKDADQKEKSKPSYW
jgi:5-methylcytosine-specific restriction protein A